MIKICNYNSPIGKITLAAENNALIGLWIEGQKYFLSIYNNEEMIEDENEAVLQEGRAFLDAYFAGNKPDPLRLKLAPEGTIYRKCVWECLLEIPYGSTISYKALSEKVGKRLGRPTSPRAIGSAVGHNPISIIIPCHRVIGSRGSLTGYAGGIDIKEQLLELEKAL